MRGFLSWLGRVYSALCVATVAVMATAIAIDDGVLLHQAWMLGGLFSTLYLLLVQPEERWASDKERGNQIVVDAACDIEEDTFIRESADSETYEVRSDYVDALLRAIDLTAELRGVRK